MKLACLFTVALLALAVTGCPQSSHGGAGPSRCSKLNEQCSMGSGVLGVCSESRCDPGQPAPCIKCTSQH